MEQENWKDVIGFEGKYQVSDLGRVRSLPRLRHGIEAQYLTKERILKPGKASNGYLTVALGRGQSKCIHRLIALHFISNPENKPQINHINGIKSDNRIANLEWCTVSENAIHAQRTGLNSPPPIKKAKIKTI